MNRNLLSLCLASALLTSLSGCSSLLSIGSSEYSCKGMPEGVKCMSAREVYAATEYSDHVDGRGDPLAPKTQKNTPAPQKERTGTDSSGNPMPSPAPSADKPIPVRSAAKVMRVWIAPFEDEKGYLHAGQYGFVEIEGRKWSLGAEHTKQSNLLSPLSVGNGRTPGVVKSPLDVNK